MPQRQLFEVKDEKICSKVFSIKRRNIGLKCDRCDFVPSGTNIVFPPKNQEKVVFSQDSLSQTLYLDQCFSTSVPKRTSVPRHTRMSSGVPPNLF